ncbi:heme ABC exporter ATP-binding protein CcmA [Paucibacter soli]|uniref:heme ABC exporter ATP-binding protein CcmA n=1 Tax=Paucibacter soli TaxID=3133433 RepID=UPI0030A64D3D
MHAPVSASNSSSPVLTARGLTCRRGRRTLFRGLDMQLRGGSITWLRGTNGSGKTSLMRILAGLSAASEGELQWRDGAGQQLIYIGHSNALKDDLTLAEALAFLARLQGLDDADARARQALGLLGLASRQEQAVRTLSQGQRRRGALARLALDDQTPRAWILDEPYDSLDSDSMAALSCLIEAHAARGGTVLLTSHQSVDLPGASEFDLEPWRDMRSRA